MSRILAFHGHNAPPAFSAALFSPLPAWSSSRLDGAGASLLWTGKNTMTGGRAGAPGGASLGPLRLVLDGFIYNRGELGQAVPEDSDAALFLALVEKYGFAEALPRINGDFAVVCHDQRDDSIWCARDRVGARPLYYFRRPGAFLAASVPGALLGLGAPPEVNPRFAALFAGSHYRLIDNSVHDSPFSHIRQLPAGHMLQHRGGECRLSRWWSPADAPELTGSEDELAEQYRELFISAVRLRLARMGNMLFTLSGGMDSSAILASSRFITGEKRTAISTVYEDATFDESAQIRAMLDDNVSEWVQVRVGNPDTLESIGRMVAAHNEPVATATWLPHWFLCEKAAAMGFDAVTSGLGGDELFGGEYEHFFFYFADLLAAGRKEDYDAEVAIWAKNHNHPLYPKNPDVASETLRRRTGANGRCLPDTALFLRYASAVRKDFYDLRSFEPAMDHPFASYLKNRCWQDIYRETSPCCIRAQDRQGAAAGLATVMPFFDPRFINFMFRLPGNRKIRHGANKQLARKAMRGILPDATCDNIVKTGWNAPAHIWFSGKNGEALLDLIRSRSFKERGIYNADAVERLALEHDHIVSRNLVAENHMMFLWQAANLELWLRWIDAKGWLAVAQS